MDEILGMLKASPPGPESSGCWCRAKSNWPTRPASRAGHRARRRDCGRSWRVWRFAGRAVSRPSAAVPRRPLDHEPRRRPDLQFPADPDRRPLRLRKSRRLPDHVRALGGRKAFVVTDPGVRSSGIVDEVTAARAEHDIEFEIYDQVTADSGSRAHLRSGRRAEVQRGRRRRRRRRRKRARYGESGGGAGDQPRLSARLRRAAQGQEPPAADVALPTTAGTGSEVSLWSVFTDDSRQAEGRDRRRPALSDRRVVRSGSDGRASARADRLHGDGRSRARDRVLHEQGLPADLRGARPGGDRADWPAPARAALNGGDRRGAVGMLLASTMAGMAMNSTRLGLAHALAMPLGSWDLKIPHSVAIAVTLPLVMEFNRLRRAGAVRRGRASARRARMAPPDALAAPAAAVAAARRRHRHSEGACPSSVCARSTCRRYRGSHEERQRRCQPAGDDEGTARGDSEEDPVMPANQSGSNLDGRCSTRTSSAASGCPRRGRSLRDQPGAAAGVSRRVRGFHRADARRDRRRRPRRRLGGHAGAAARRHALPLRAAARRVEDGARPDRHARTGQGARRGSWRSRPRRGRSAVHGGRSQPRGRADLSERAGRFLLPHRRRSRSGSSPRSVPGIFRS